MRILHLNWSGNIGGIENYTINLAKKQRELGLDARIGYLSKVGILGDYARRFDIPVTEFGMSSGFDIFNFKAYINYIKSYKPDVVHAHDPTPIVYLSKLFYPRGKYIRHFHGTSIGNKRWERKRALLFNNITTSLVDFFVTNSMSTKQIVLNKYKLIDNRIAVLYNGLDLDDFYPTKSRDEIKGEFNIRKDDKIIGTICRLEHNKGLDKFIEIARQIIPQNPNVKFIIVGEGSLYSSLKAQVDSLLLSNKIMFTGFRLDIPNLLSIFDIFLFTSECESFGLVLLEAMRIGVPIIAFNIDGIREVVNDNCAILVPRGAISEMTRSVVDILTNRDIREKLINNGFMKVRHFDIKNITEKTIKLYRRLVNC